MQANERIPEGSSVESKLRETVEPSLNAMGYRIVLLRMNDGAQRKVLQVMAEREDEVPMSFDDCEEISATVSALLDVEDPISGAYSLEVMSPGLDRPLTSLKDFTTRVGAEIKLEVALPIDGRKRFRGVIAKAGSDGAITLRLPEGEEVALAFHNIRSAKLVVSDEVVREALRKDKNK